MKKHKRVLCIMLTALLLMISAAMASFGATFQWDEGYRGAITDAGYFDAVRSWNADSDGLVTSTVTWPNPDTGEEQSESIKYYDFNYSYIDAADKWSYEDFINVYDEENSTVDVPIKLLKPSYAIGGEEEVNYQNSDEAGLSLKVTANGFVSDSDIEQSVTLSCFITINSESKSEFIGTVPSKTITIQPKQNSIIASGQCGSSLTWTLDNQGVLTISGKGAFQNYSNVSHSPWTDNKEDIVTVVLEEGVTSIGDQAFRDCRSLASINIPDSVVSIGELAFFHCISLRSITIPNSVANVGISAFSGCSNLTSINIPDAVMIINGGVFSDCSSLTSINIPDGVTSIGSSAFSGCSNLTSINIPSGVMNIGHSAFSGCSKLKSISIPDGVTSIDNSTFNECSSLTSINIPDSVVSIGQKAFKNCSSLTSITIPDSLTSIGNYAFANCLNLKNNITIPDGVKGITDHVFSGCKSLTNVTLSDSVTVIGEFAFYGCSSLTSITIPDHLISINRYAFWGCNLTSITLPDSVTVIGEYAFCGCDFTSITIPNGMTKIESYTFEDCTKLMNITLPNGLVSIGGGAFSKCTTLKSITIPDGVVIIDSAAFYNCSSLISITIPNSVTSIGENVFQNCNKLKYIFFTGTESQWESLENRPPNVTIHYESTGHTWGEEYATDKEATCKEEGSESIHCSVCGAIKEGSSRPIPKTDHNFGEWETTQAATCTEPGRRRGICLFCGARVLEEIPAKGHTWNEEYTTDKEATCTEEGSESIHCSVCGAIKEGSSRPIAKTEHSYGEWTTVTAATCIEAGSREKVCSVCEDKITEEIPAKGHTLTHFAAKEATTTTAGNTEYWYCDTCKKYFTDADGNNETTQAATIIPKLPDDTGGGSSGGDTPSPGGGGGGGASPGGDEPTVSPEDEAKQVTEAIAALSSDSPDPAAVAAARDAYNKLSDEAKKSVPAETLKKLEAAEVKVVVSFVEALDEEYPDPDAVAEAKSAYEKLSDGAKSAFPAETLNKLEAAEAAVIANEQKAVGAETVVSAGTVTVTSTENKTVAFTAASSSKKSIVIPATVEIAGETFKVTEVSAGAFKGTAATSVTIGKNVKKISSKAFAGSKVTKLIVKSKKLTKKSVKNSLKGSKVKTVQVKVGTKKQNKAYSKRYKKYFTKANAGMKVTVK